MYWDVTITNGASLTQTSEIATFRAYNTPTVEILNIPSPVPSQDYEFQGNYVGADGLQLERFQFLLYDSTVNNYTTR